MTKLAVGCFFVTVAVYLTRPFLRFMEFDDLREGQLEAAAAMVITVAAAVLFGRYRREGSRRSLLLVAGLMRALKKRSEALGGTFRTVTSLDGWTELVVEV
ncbi:MAG: hypothetical protein ACXW1S_04980 [Acidimicrobiia bacterium]